MYDALVLDAVGKVLDVFGPEEVVAAVAHVVGDIDAHGAQRVQAVAAARLQITVDPGQRVHHLNQGFLAADILHVADGVRLVNVDVVGYLGLLGIAARMKRVGCRRGEIAVVAQDGIDHVHTRLGIHSPDEHRLGGKVLVQPSLEARRVLVDVVVNHQPEGERRAVIGRVERIVGTDVDGREDVVLHTLVELDTVLVVLEAFHSRVEHIALAQFLGRRARRRSQCEHRSQHKAHHQVCPIHCSHHLSFVLQRVY